LPACWSIIGNTLQLLVDNGLGTKSTSYRYAAIVDQAAAINLRELRIVRAGVLRVLSPLNAGATQSLVLGKLTGDNTGVLRMSARTMLVMPTPTAPSVADTVQTTDFLPAVTFNAATFAQSSAFSVTYTRQYAVATATTINVGIQTDASSTVFL